MKTMLLWRIPSISDCQVPLELAELNSQEGLNELLEKAVFSGCRGGCSFNSGGLGLGVEPCSVGMLCPLGMVGSNKWSAPQGKKRRLDCKLLVSDGGGPPGVGYDHPTVNRTDSNKFGCLYSDPRPLFVVFGGGC